MIRFIIKIAMSIGFCLVCLNSMAYAKFPEGAFCDDKNPCPEGYACNPIWGNFYSQCEKIKLLCGYEISCPEGYDCVADPASATQYICREEKNPINFYY